MAPVPAPVAAQVANEPVVAVAAAPADVKSSGAEHIITVKSPPAAAVAEPTCKPAEPSCQRVVEQPKCGCE